MSGRILIVGDEPNIIELIETIHRNAGWRTATAIGCAEAVELLEARSFDVVFLDLAMQEEDGIEVLEYIKLRRRDQAVVILIDRANIERAVEATRLGAFDFVEEDCSEEMILHTSRNALEYFCLAEDNRRLREMIWKKREYLGAGDKAREVRDQINNVAATDARVLILGESGTGKELIARAIHEGSRRSGGPFMKVNCAAIPDELMEAELFGSEKGPDDGSVGSRVGKFQAADGGTIFFDEVAVMSTRMQTKMLHVLQGGDIKRVGGDETIRVDVRVISATSRDLDADVAGGNFREDLFSRLNVVRLQAPTLRELPDEIPQLAEAFLDQYCTENGLVRKKFDPKVIKLLQRYPWPGNARELRNQVERMVIMAPGREVRVEDCSAEIRAGVPPLVLSRRGERVEDAERALDAQEPPSPELLVDKPKTLLEARKELERNMILEALRRYDWNISKAAEALGLQRTNLHKKIKQLRLTRK